MGYGSMAARIGVVAAGLVLVACATETPKDMPGSILETPLTAEQSEADEAAYLARVNNVPNLIRTQPRDGGYDPLVPVEGSSSWMPLPVAMPEERSISEEALKAVHDYAEAGNTNTLIVWRNGKVEHAAYWNDFTVEEPQISYSLAKPVTAAAVGRAIKLGYIDSLDQPLIDFIPEWADTEKAGILVRNLLDMRSGLMPQANALEPGNVLLRAYLHPRHIDVIVNEVPLTHVPGTRYEYNNATSEMVSALIERATGQRYEDFVSEQVLQKIGALGGKIWLNREGGVAHSGCCILLPPETFLRLAILLSQDGVWNGEALYPEGYAEAVRTPTDENPWAALGAVYVAGEYIERRGAGNPETVPLGHTLHGEPYLDKDIYLFDGNNNQSVHVSPATGIVVLRTGKRPPKEPEWDNTYIINTLIRGIKLEPGETLPEPQPGP